MEYFNRLSSAESSAHKPSGPARSFTHAYSILHQHGIQEIKCLFRIFCGPLKGK